MPPQQDDTVSTIEPPTIQGNPEQEEQQQKKRKSRLSFEDRNDDESEVLHLKAVAEDPANLPDPNVQAKPLVFLQDMVEAMHGYRPVVRETLKLNGYFDDVTDARIAAYNMTVLNATRNNKLDELKDLYETKDQRMDCCNRFGESLLHMACRRGFVDIVQFFVEGPPSLPVRIRDDCGRTPLHDICWNPIVELEAAQLILERDATLLLMSDKRGHAPFDYSRCEHWAQWRTFLFENRQTLLGPLGSRKVRDVFEDC